MKKAVPLIDVRPLVLGRADLEDVAAQMREACTRWGFFYVTGHGIEVRLQRRLETLSRAFFAMDLASKMQIRMALGGRAWRGYFPLGDELTSGRPDMKEGLYFGAELDDSDPRVRSQVPLHGKNLFPPGLQGFRETVLEYMDAMRHLGHRLMEGIAVSLGLERAYFARHYMSDPLTLFRIFHYPPVTASRVEAWGVGEHTDYGVLTILKQDEVGGLQVKSGGAWVTADPIADTFVCNIGDMLDRMTGGFYRSTPHRVKNRGTEGRLSFPFFFDPNFDAVIRPIEFADRAVTVDDAVDRWDRVSVHAFEGTYGDYLLAKVAKVFPELASGV